MNIKKYHSHFHLAIQKMQKFTVLKKFNTQKYTEVHILAFMCSNCALTVHRVHKAHKVHRFADCAFWGIIDNLLLNRGAQDAQNIQVSDVLTLMHYK